VRHHLDPKAALAAYSIDQAVLSKGDFANDTALMGNGDDMAAIATANVLGPNALSDDEVAQIMAFLEALTDYDSLDGRLGVPDKVPSGLPLDR
jgi:cytochrome c peroxidase